MTASADGGIAQFLTGLAFGVILAVPIMLGLGVVWPDNTCAQRGGATQVQTVEIPGTDRSVTETYCVVILHNGKPVKSK